MDEIREIDFNDMVEDDLEIFEIINHGFPRQIYHRTHYMDSFDELSFFKRFRLTKETTMEVLSEIEHRLEFAYETNNCVSAVNQLLVALRYFATGSHLLSIADFCGMHVSTSCRIVKRVSAAIAELCPQVIRFPATPEDILMSQRRFFDIAGFPRVVGVIDCTHIRIQSPGGEDAEIYRNRKGYHSINVQAVADASLKFVNIVVRWPGSSHDSTIFNNSRLRRQFENGEFENALLLGDSGYNIRPFLLTPLLHPHTEAEQLYNESHIRTRNIIERVFGVWKRRFPVLAYGCRLKVHNILTVIVATAVLHNIARDKGEEPPEIAEEYHMFDDLINHGQIPSVPQTNDDWHGIVVRENFVDNYFNTL